MDNWLLGKNTAYDSNYNPDLLTAVPRQLTRENIGIASPLPFKGVDIWNAWELSWLNGQGKPVVACARFQYSANSPNIIESKSFKLYLNSFNQTKFITTNEVLDRLKNDLGYVVEAEVEVSIYSADDNWPVLQQPKGICLDDIDVEISNYQLSPDYLVDSVRDEKTSVSEQLYSHLFKSNCMVTGQPDWASIFINYTGKVINHTSILKYLISFRDHQAFHEPCVEQVFIDLMKHCKPDSLSVYCRYTRRGGLDINPFRSTTDSLPDNNRIWRQ